jgi:hypothetical protein
VEFHHVGIPAPAKREGMRYLEPTRSWLSSIDEHPYRVEWQFFQDDSPVHELIRTLPHVAYLVDNLEEAMGSHPVLAEPFDVWGEVRVSFIEVDGAPVEFVELYS